MSARYLKLNDQRVTRNRHDLYGAWSVGMGALIKFLDSEITGSDRRVVADLSIRIVVPQILQTPLSLITPVQRKGRRLLVRKRELICRNRDFAFTLDRSVGNMPDARFESFTIRHLSHGLLHG